MAFLQQVPALPLRRVYPFMKLFPGKTGKVSRIFEKHPHEVDISRCGMAFSRFLAEKPSFHAVHVGNTGREALFHIRVSTARGMVVRQGLTDKRDFKEGHKWLLTTT